MPGDGDRRLRFQIAGQVLPKLPNSDLGCLHGCTSIAYAMITHTDFTWLRTRRAERAEYRPNGVGRDSTCAVVVEERKAHRQECLCHYSDGAPSFAPASAPCCRW